MSEEVDLASLYLEMFYLVCNSGYIYKGCTLIHNLLPGKYGEDGFRANNATNSVTKASAVKSSEENKVTVVDTMGLLDTNDDAILQNQWDTLTKQRKIDIIQSHIDVLKSIGSEGLDAIFLVCEQNRFHKCITSAY